MDSELDMCISNYLSLVSSVELLVIASILRPADTISDQGYLINVFILYKLIINNKNILLCIL